MICKPDGELETARQRLEADLPGVLNLRPMPAIALRITEACQNQQANLHTVIEMVQCDPTISSQILSVVNSPIYGNSREIVSLKQAVVVLGFKRLSELAVSIASKQVFAEGDESCEQRMHLYSHSLACATLARILASRGGNTVDAGAAFLTGILHDIGKLFLFDLAPTAYSQFQEDLNQESTIELEREAFGKTHAELGMHFARASGLPESIHAAIAEHHGDVSAEQTELAKITGLASSLVKVWGIGGGRPTAMNPVAEQWLALNDEETIDEVRETATSQFQALESMFSG